MNDSEKDEVIKRRLQMINRECRVEIGYPIFFFRKVEECLDREIDKANAELCQQGVPTGQDPRTIEKQLTQSRVRDEFSFGPNLACTVALGSSFSFIEAVLTSEPERPGSSTEQLLAFQLESSESGVKAYKMNLEPLPEGKTEMTALEIAETIVAGLLRGSFD